MADSFETFLHDYEDRVDDLRRSDWTSLSLYLSDWLDLLDNAPQSYAVIKDLDGKCDFKTWFAEAQASKGSMVGTGRLNWSRDRTIRLAQQLGLMRYLASGEDVHTNFSIDFAWASSNLNDNKYKLVDEYIEPFARDLLRHIERVRATETLLPASDRVVPLDHNSPGVRELGEKLDQVERQMKASNSLKHEPELERNLAEIGAARRLFEAATVRISALTVLLVPALKWLADKATDAVIAIAIGAIAALLASLFGITIPGLA
jgi:hypothetical protein